MKKIYGKITVRAEERDEYGKVVKVSTFSLSNITIDEADEVISNYEAMLRVVCGFKDYAITRTFRF